MEHHSNIIPWQIICKKTGAKIKYLKSTEHGTINLEDLKNSLDKAVKIVSITHASNVFGTINPIKEIVDIVKKNGSKIMIDGCQSIPHMNIDVKDLDCDFYAFSGHKMFGPTGVGVLYGKEEILEEIFNNKSNYFKKKENLKKLNYQNTWINANQKILKAINEN